MATEFHSVRDKYELMNKYEFRISKSLAVFSRCTDLCPPIAGEMPMLLCFSEVTSSLHSFVDKQ